ncbi:MAG: MGH1-like glycoside hydrolase domain-containing protein [Pseudobacter sp.]|uniref:MGH1-like glycoside hydrolase domain-containing protein n=1 Tax=Pseudobacter sp. TaxID=2045420 RepID=UPI003F81E663
MNSKGNWIFTAMLAIAAGTHAQQQENPVWSSPAYRVYGDRVVQGKYTARAVSATEMRSDYQSPANLFKSSEISFKFSINGKDNEMLSGKDHGFNIVPVNGYAETPLIPFGKQLKPGAGAKSSFLPPNTKLKLRLDMREVLASFKSKGYYVTFKGDKIYKEDFKGVFVAGGSAPMIWDFDNLVHHPELELKDDDGDGVFETTLLMNAPEQQNNTDAEWKVSKDLSAFPQYRSSYPLADALYNLSIEEMIRSVEPDSTFRTGKEWAGVWTRDISYSIILSMAYLQPEVAKYSLLRKVSKKKKIIQDTGTGGAWPVSTDRMVWAIAAWELYKATGDREWLAQAYEIIKNSIEDDLQNVYDAETGMVKGESSFLDWREQTYPRWMQPADIFESENLGTNAVHYEANQVLARMAGLLKQTTVAEKHAGIAAKIKAGINKYLWLPSQQFYGQYIYGRKYKSVSPRSEALGEALCILFDIADAKQQQQIISNGPVTTYGTPCIYPDIPEIPPYHNNAVWPFVQAYWLWAGAKVGNTSSVTESISAIYRPAALFLTNKENFVATNGDFTGTQINSSNMLWSLSGNISIVHKVFFGLQFMEDKLVFKPFVPAAWKGKKQLNNFRYRNTVLDIELEGAGNNIESFELDGKNISKAELPADLSGRHRVRIKVGEGSGGANQSIKKVAGYTSLPAPELQLKNGIISWKKIQGAVKYRVLKNGKEIVNTTALQYRPAAAAEYQVIATDKMGVPSFASEPLDVLGKEGVTVIEAEAFAPVASYAYKGFSGKGFVEISTSVNRSMEVPVNVKETGWYFVDARYANGNGPTNTENKCAVRTVEVNGKSEGIWVFPQRGKEEWSNWGYTNSIRVHLTAGSHTLRIYYADANGNMNEEINQAMIDHLRLIRF